MGDDLSRTVARSALVVAALTACAAAVAAFLQASPAAVGWLAAITAFGAAVAFGATARGLRAPDDLREPRVRHGDTEPVTLPSDVTRSGVFSRFWGLAVGAVAILGVVPFLAIARNPIRSGTAWTRGARLVTPDGKPLRADDLAIGGVETVFPEGHVSAPQAATLLLRLPPDVTIDPERGDWVRNGNVAYSKICTHAGCPVAIYRAQSLELYCPCHQSVFDVVHRARPVSGPATRALPQLALDVDGEGYLVARGDFTEPVGPDFWERTS